MLNKEITELEITSSDDKFFDFGVDAFGQLELVITSTGGKKIEVAIGEVAENGKINPTPGGYRCYKKAERLLSFSLLRLLSLKIICLIVQLYKVFQRQVNPSCNNSDQ